MKLDSRNKRILYELWNDARIPASQIAKKLNLSREVVEYRIKQLIKDKYIQEFITIIDTNRLGYKQYTIHLQLKNFEEEKEAEIITYLKNHDYVKWIVTSSGKWDVIFNMIAKNEQQFDDILSKICYDIKDNLRTYNVFSQTKLYKDADILFLKEKEETQTWKKEEKQTKIKLDEKDLKILELLSRNARAHILEIAKNVQLTPEAVSYRIKKLKSQGIIKNFRAVINISKLDQLWYYLMLQVEGLDPQAEKDIKGFFKEHKKIFFVDKLIGEWNLRIEVLAKDHEEFHKIFMQIRKKLQDYLKSYELSIIFKDLHQVSYTNGIIKELKKEIII
jgi:DNA-binding Lrp family transcriptional regulator